MKTQNEEWKKRIEKKAGCISQCFVIFRFTVCSPIKRESDVRKLAIGNTKHHTNFNIIINND